MESPKIINKDTYEVIWTIPNHPTVISTAANLPISYKAIRLSSQSGAVYQGQIGYHSVDSQTISPCLKLANHNSQNCFGFTLIVWSMSQKRSNDQWVFIPDSQVETLLTRDIEWVHPTIKLNTSFPMLWDGSSQLIVSYKVTLYMFEISVTEPMGPFITAFSTTHKENWAKCLEKADSITADLKIVCNDGVELLAHQLVVLQNDVLAAEMKKDAMTEGKYGVINLQEINSSTMKILLHFFYTGELFEEECMQPELILDFTLAAGKYMLKDVLKMLDARLGMIDHGENTVKLMSLANEPGLKNAEARLVNRVKEMVQSAQGSKNIMELFGVSYRLMQE